MDTSLGRSFWTLWAAFSSSNLGDGLSLVAMPLLAIQVTDDARLIAMVSVFQFLPFLVFALPAGVVLDRLDRRWIAVVAQTLRAAVFGGLVAVIVSGRADITVLMAASFLIGMSEVMTDGGLPALVREVVNPAQLEVANSRLMATQRSTNQFIGPPLGAVMFEVRTWLPFTVAIVASLFSVVTLTLLPGQYRPEQAQQRPPFRVQATAGLRYVWDHPVLRPLALSVGAFSFAGAATTATFVVLVTERFGLGGVGFGVLMSVDAIVSVIATFFVARFISATSHATSMRFAIVCFCLASLLLGLTTTAAIAFAASMILGLSDPSWNVVSATVRQRLVPDEVFGRMMTAYLFIAWGMKPVGAILGGVVAEQWGPQWVSIGAACVVGSLLIVARPMFGLVNAAMARPDAPSVGR